jgi:uncharacterized protein (DUF433 family)
MDIIRSDKQILGGTPCFAGTRVPVKSLFDYLEDNCSVEEFLDQFPTVRREQVLALLDAARRYAESEALGGKNEIAA